MLLGLVALAAPAFAQNTFVSPVGTEVLEGNGISSVNFGTYANSRIQYLDGNQRGTPRPNIRAVSMRRDGGSATNTTSGPRTVTLGLVMAHTNQAAASTTFANNYLNSASTTVYTPKPTNLPDHRPQTTVPAPWTLRVPFDVMFNYNGTNDLLWETTGTANSLTTAYSLDTATNGSTAGGGAGGFYYNGLTGCVVPPNTQQFDIISSATATNAAGQVTIQWYALRGPVSSPAVLALGATDPNIVAPFLCAPLRTSAEILVPTSTDASGSIASAAAPLRFTFPFPGSVPFNIYGQFAAVDVAATRLYLSDATAHAVVPYTAPVIRALTRILNTTSPTATTGSSSTFCSVARFEY
jgi:hypothetical protein